MASVETTALLVEARAGSRAAREALFARCAAKLLPLVRLRMTAGLRAHLESRDILQAVLARSLGRLDQLEQAEGRSLMAWLARIAENEIRDQWERLGRQRRDASRTVPIDDARGITAPEQSVLSGLIASERVSRLVEALGTLTDDHREAILLRAFEELSFKEVGARLGRSEDAARMLFARAMTALTLTLRTP